MFMTKKAKWCVGILSGLLAVVTAVLIYILTGEGAWMVQTPPQDSFLSYLSSKENLYDTETGILHTVRTFRAGTDQEIRYEFEHPDFVAMKNKYNLKETAGEGSEFQKALRLMNAYSNRLRHESSFDNQIGWRGLDLLEYGLDKKNQGINCRGKAQILNEMCLALGIHARKVWLIPASIYDQECHVVNEIWDNELSKWVMLDISNNLCWVDDKGSPLSILEIRDHLAERRFCTPVTPEDSLKDLEKSLEQNYGNFLYILKNMAWFYCPAVQGVGEADSMFILLPEVLTAGESLQKMSREISREAFERPPMP